MIESHSLKPAQRHIFHVSSFGITQVSGSCDSVLSLCITVGDPDVSLVLE